MRNAILTLLSILFIVAISSCRKDFSTSASSGNLTFSKDTVYLDTVFTNIGSSTYNLKVYNNSGDDIHIPTIELGRGTNSNFRLNVDGIAGQYFENIEIKSKDSIFIFIETTVDILDETTTATEFLYKDSIIFDGVRNYQDVKLVTLVKDAEFIYPAALNDGELNNFDLTPAQLNWTNEKPYVIYGYPTVPNGETLTIEEGARIHFHRNSGLIVSNGATITADGDISSDQDLLEKEIIFEGDRLEPLYSDIPGQWGTIWLQEGSTNNLFDHVTIKNGTIGLRNDLNDGNLTTTLNNVQLYNHSVNAILAIGGNIEANNLIAGNCGQATVALTAGGTYNFNHCTLTNYWTNGFRSFPTLLVSNQLQAGETLIVGDLLAANFTNTIVYGNENLEFNLEKNNSAAFNYNFTNCLLRFNDTNQQFANNPLYDFSNTLGGGEYSMNIYNNNPNFLNQSNNEFLIELGNSPADDTGVLTGLTEDILGNTRSSGNTDMGAYQADVFPTDD
ncbi:hypothetical protein [Pseudofulvibacter geojedonensis]|uniref:Lipoprotein n=1 Tax=Pseudofulvibacter geojedonensis TaxID=1123758 RepID=A0ABW3HYW8_9FLAO